MVASELGPEPKHPADLPPSPKQAPGPRATNASKALQRFTELQEKWRTIGNVPATADKHELGRWNAEARQSRERSRGDLYRYVDITRSPSPFAFEDAVKVLSMWGVGVSAKQYRRASTPDRRGVDEEAHGQCLWLVAEHPPKPAAPAPTSRKAA